MSPVLIVGALLLALAVLAWPSPWADPRSPLWVEARQNRRSGIERGRAGSPAAEVGTAAQLMSIALRTGLPMELALEAVARHCSSELARDLWPVIAAYERGADSEHAWRAAPEIWRPVAAALTVSQRAGLAPSTLLLSAATAIIRRESVHRESAIGGVSVRLVLPLGAVLLPAFMATTVIPLVLVMTRGFLTS